MDKKQFVTETNEILKGNLNIERLAKALEELWLKGEVKTTGLITEELRKKLKVVGTDVGVLKTIGQVVGKYAKKDLDKFVPLSQTLWNQYGLEGRVVAAHILSAMNLINPEKILSVSKNLLGTCVTWGECDNMAYAVEPIFRKDPENYLDKLHPWLVNKNKWIKRVALNVIARLPMKQPKYTRKALNMIIPCLEYDDNDVRRTCSFAIRLSARGSIKDSHDFIKDNLGGNNPTKIWIFCDAIRSMTKSFLPKFKDLLPNYQKWLQSTKDTKSKKSLEAAIKLLKSA